MLGTLRCCTHMKHMNHASLAFNNSSLGQVITGLAHHLNYSQDKGTGCCKDVPQTAGKKVEPWPKTDPPPPQPWRAECSMEPQPPNYDPYRIKVPEVVVPPLPPSNAKRTGVVYTTSDQPGRGQESSYQHPHQSAQGYSQGLDSQTTEEETNKDPGFFGMLKGFFGKLRGKGKEGEGDSMIDTRDIQWLYR